VIEALALIAGGAAAGVFGSLLGLGGGVLHGFGLLFILFGMAGHAAAWIMGLGAVILDRLNGPAAAGAVPPVPLTPPPPTVPPTPPMGTTPADPLPLSERWEEEDERRRWEEPPPPER
jgi:hypothetical protein